jgi:hypothetical protein
VKKSKSDEAEYFTSELYLSSLPSHVWCGYRQDDSKKIS